MLSCWIAEVGFDLFVVVSMTRKKRKRFENIGYNFLYLKLSLANRNPLYHVYVGWTRFSHYRIPSYEKEKKNYRQVPTKRIRRQISLSIIFVRR